MDLCCRFMEADGEVAEVKLVVIPDTGAARTIIPLKAVPAGAVVAPSRTRLFTAGGAPLDNSGTVSFSACVAGGPRTVIQAVVSTGLVGPPLVGCNDLEALGVLPASFPAVDGVTCAVIALPEDDDVAHVDRVGVEEDGDENGEPVPAAAAVAVEDDVDELLEDPDHLGVGDDSLEKIVADFADVLVSDLGQAAGCIKGDAMHVELDPARNIKPLHVTTARQVPVHIQPLAKKLVQELLAAKALVRCYEPTEWSSPGHFLLKACGKKARLITDYRRLNEAIGRPIHPFNSAADLMRKVSPGSTWFAKLDAVHGYFQVPLDHASSLLTTFLIAEGKFRYLVAPMGLNSSSDEFCIRTDEAMRDFFEWLLKIIDDMLVQGRTLQEVFQRLRLVLQRARETGIKLSLSKLAVGRSLKFAGFIVGRDGIRPDPAKVASLRNFPTPKTVTDLKSFLGLANQLGSFLPDFAHSTVQMRLLLKKENAFVWLDVHDRELDLAKSLLCSAALVKPFDAALSTELLTDASRLYGLGYALLQRELSGRPRLVQCGSCALTDAQRNYATVELEASAILWAAQKCDHYLRGMLRFLIFTDHKPLVGAFDKPLAAMANDRLQRIRERLMVYSFDLRWTAGKLHQIADALYSTSSRGHSPSWRTTSRTWTYSSSTLSRMSSSAGSSARTPQTAISCRSSAGKNGALLRASAI
jgi:hypothetical protein